MNAEGNPLGSSFAARTLVLRRGAREYQDAASLSRTSCRRSYMEALSAAALGLVLAACAGLRAFLPIFSASVAASMSDMPLSGWTSRRRW
jgi:hypothetical protein